MEEIKERIDKLLGKLNIQEKIKKIRELEAEATKPDFWQDHQKAAEKMKELSVLQKEIQEIEQLGDLVQKENQEEAEKLLDQLETLLYFSGPYDEGSAILSIHSGQGGVEA